MIERGLEPDFPAAARKAAPAGKIIDHNTICL
jgi:hypothetical protein